MHVSQVKTTLGVLQISMITMTVLQRKHAGHPLIEAVPGVSNTMLSGAMPRRIATLIEADPMAIKKIGISTSATLIPRGTNRMTIKQMILPIAETHLSEGIPPFGGMTMTVRPLLITN